MNKPRIARAFLPSLPSHVLAAMVSAILLVIGPQAIAKDYKVEVLLFENLVDQPAYESHNYSPPVESISEAETWFIEPTMLLEDATTIKRSKDYRLKHYFSWGQESLPAEEAAYFTAREGLLSGQIKVYAKTLLFANLDLEYDGYRMMEKRRLKLNERHFFDHPKFGVLMQVSRLEPEEITDEVE